MSILTVITVPNPILKQKALPVTQFDASLEKLLQDMLETMRVEKGVGLAAPQVGILQRIFVAEYRRKLHFFINPIIIAAKGKAMGEEGCLSIPNIRLKVERATSISIQAQNPNGSTFTLKLNNMMARIAQHEIDHLEGILITDRSSTPAET